MTNPVIFTLGNPQVIAVDSQGRFTASVYKAIANAINQLQSEITALQQTNQNVTNLTTVVNNLPSIAVAVDGYGTIVVTYADDIYTAKLVNDDPAPSPLYFYGTNMSGVKGYQPLHGEVMRRVSKGW
jgi:hypothetical protein